MSLNFDRFWPIWWIEKKKFIKGIIFDLSKLTHIFVTSVKDTVVSN